MCLPSSFCRTALCSSMNDCSSLVAPTLIHRNWASRGAATCSNTIDTIDTIDTTVEVSILYGSYQKPTDKKGKAFPCRVSYQRPAQKWRAFSGKQKRSCVVRGISEQLRHEKMVYQTHIDVLVILTRHKEQDARTYRGGCRNICTGSLRTEPSDGSFRVR